MQLGELQNQLHRFNKRKASIVGISVDPPTDSLAMIKRLGLGYDLASDPDQAVVKSFGVQNPETQELALHAVYILNSDGQIVYRKVARRRPVSAELVDAIDAALGTYPQYDSAAPRKRVQVAYPTNNFQALLEVSQADALPKAVHADAYAQVLSLIKQRKGDDAIFAFRQLLQNSGVRDQAALMDAVRYLVFEIYFQDLPEALETGRDLARRLERVRQLEKQEEASRNTPDHDKALHTLAAARAGLTRVRAQIEANAQAWKLRSAKTSLRGYRELVLAYLRAEASN